MAFLDKIFNNIKNKFKGKHPIQCNNNNKETDLNIEDLAKSSSKLKPLEVNDKLPEEDPIEILENSGKAKDISNKENNIADVSKPQHVDETVITIFGDDLVVTKSPVHDYANNNENNKGINYPPTAILENPQNVEQGEINMAKIEIQRKLNVSEREFSLVLEKNNEVITETIKPANLGFVDVVSKVNMSVTENISYDSLEDKLDGFENSENPTNDLLEIRNGNSKRDIKELTENSLIINDANNNVTSKENDSVDTACSINFNSDEHIDTNENPNVDFEELIDNLTPRHGDQNKEIKDNTSESFKSGDKATDDFDVISISSDEFGPLRPPRDDIETISISSADTVDERHSANTNVEVLAKITQETSPNNDANSSNGAAIDGKSVDSTISHFDISTSNAEEDDGYNSSDFEFITEAEALKDGIIINYRTKPPREGGTCKTIEITESTRITSSKAPNNTAALSRQSESIETFNSNPGPSNRIELSRQSVHPAFNYRRNHVIPVGEDYYKLFQEVNLPLPLYMLENKSMINSSSMNIEYQGIGFNLNVLRKLKECESDSEELKEEARQNALKITQKYPRDNRKRRRIH